MSATAPGYRPGTEEVRLRREMPGFSVTMIGVGAMIGAGIFVLTGIAAGVAGPGLLLAFAYINFRGAPRFNLPFAGPSGPKRPGRRPGHTPAEGRNRGWPSCFRRGSVRSEGT